VTVWQTLTTALALIGLTGWAIAVFAAQGRLVALSLELVVVASGAVGVAALTSGMLISVFVLAPLRSTADRVERVRSLAELTAVFHDLGDADLRTLLGGALGLLRSSDAQMRAQTAFFAALIHDLRTRVAGITHLTDRSARGAMRRNEDEVVATELREIAHWLRRILDAIRLDQLDAIGERTETDVRVLVDEIVADLASEAPRDVQVLVDGSATASVVNEELARALANLLSNAVRVARSTVNVEIFQGLVRIADDGPGLPMSLDSLSQPFKRVSDVGDRATASGTGLGLYVARRILELHGGKLVCERSDPRGTVLLAYLGR
jgi:signal transduction histidine kinase